MDAGRPGFSRVTARGLNAPVPDTTPDTLLPDVRILIVAIISSAFEETLKMSTGQDRRCLIC